MILSILIPTLPEREQSLARLMEILTPQLTDQVEVITDPRTRGHVTTGEKRNHLLLIAKGKYSIFLDDDDWVPAYYVSELLKAAESNPDCIVFKGWMTTNGKSRVNFVLRLGEKYEERNGMYYRFPNHITAMKTEIARMAKFPNVTMGEDYRWALEIKDRNLLKSEVFIDKDMYHYDYKTNK